MFCVYRTTDHGEDNYVELQITDMALAPRNVMMPKS
jgi:hypothetical protein